MGSFFLIKALRCIVCSVLWRNPVEKWVLQISTKMYLLCNHLAERDKFNSWTLWLAFLFTFPTRKIQIIPRCTPSWGLVGAGTQVLTHLCCSCGCSCPSKTGLVSSLGEITSLSSWKILLSWDLLLTLTSWFLCVDSGGDVQTLSDKRELQYLPHESWEDSCLAKAAKNCI